MENLIYYKEQFIKQRDELFNNEEVIKHSYKFCKKYSLLVEEYIINLVQPHDLSYVMAASGGFSRRELSPYSDIDLMFILPQDEIDKSHIENCISKLCDSEVNVSYTVREFDDIERFMKEDLHAFTQFFETRFILGNKNIYDEWNAKLFRVIEQSDKQKLIFDLFRDVETRYQKFGSSPKILEPNVKFTGGGLRDILAVEWIYSIKNQALLSGQDEVTQTEIFLKELAEKGIINRKAKKRLTESYETVLKTRNLLHLTEGRKNDRLEFTKQKIIAEKLGYSNNNWKEFMHNYFRASTILNRFSKTMMKRYKKEFSTELSEILTINIDDDFEIKGNIMAFKSDKLFSISEIMRAYYYRCSYDAIFNLNLRSLIIESIHLIEESQPIEATSSVFFREMLKLPANVAKTLSAMNEVGFLDVLLPDFKNLNGFFQPGVYHCYTADEHSIIALRNLESLSVEDNSIARLFKSLPSRDLLYLAILLHDIGKPISVSGHEIIGAEIANSIMQSLGYGQSEVLFVQFLVKHHLTMEQTAFSRNLNDPVTLDNFISIFPSVKTLDHLYLLTYANLSAVNPKVWTQWKADLLHDLYSKSKAMLEKQLSGEELISAKSFEEISQREFNNDDSVIDHLEQINDPSYVFHFSNDEINNHIEEIEKGSKISIFFKDGESFTSISVIAKDSGSLLASLCGVFAIHNLSIHDAKIFTRNNGIVINTFNVMEFDTEEFVNTKKYKLIENDLIKAVEGKLKLEKEFERAKSKWKKVPVFSNNKTEEIKINFEDHKKYTIIDVYTKDKIGLLYTITRKMAELGLTINFAKVSTKIDDVIDSFYVLKNNGEKLKNNELEFIRTELINEIKEL